MSEHRRSRALSIGTILVVMAVTAVGLVKVLGGSGDSADANATTVALSGGRTGGGERDRQLTGTTLVRGADGEGYTAYTATLPGGAPNPASPATSADPANTGATVSTAPPGSPRLPLTAAQAAAGAKAPVVGSSTTPTTTATTKATAGSSTTKATTASTAATQPPAQASGGMTAVENQIVQMTNELRTNPNGPLARKGATPACVTKDASGRIQPVPALKVNTAVAIQLSRDWSMQMDKANVMSHRSNEASLTFYKSQGLPVSTYGENVAWFSGYSDSQAAQVFFEGWRESEGHYCNMMNPAYTFFGVGVYKGASKSWATQNFYGTR